MMATNLWNQMTWTPCQLSQIQCCEHTRKLIKDIVLNNLLEFDVLYMPCTDRMCCEVVDTLRILAMRWCKVLYRGIGIRSCSSWTRHKNHLKLVWSMRSVRTQALRIWDGGGKLLCWLLTAACVLCRLAREIPGVHTVSSRLGWVGLGWVRSLHVNFPGLGRWRQYRTGHRRW
jgi:hypothetical protein